MLLISVVRAPSKPLKIYLLRSTARHLFAHQTPKAAGIMAADMVPQRRPLMKSGT